MSVIANLDVNVRGNTGGIEKAVNATIKSLGGLGSAATAAISGIAALGLAAVGAGAAIFTMSRGQAGAIDSLAKSADRIGVTTEALAGLQHAGKMAGVEAGEMDGMLSGMTQTLTKVGMGGGEAGRALARIGVNLKDMQGLSPDEQFLQIAEALNDVGDQSKKLVLANEIGGDSLAKLVSVYRGGSAEIKKAMQEAGALGLTVSREEAAQVEESNRSMTKMKEGFTGLLRTAAIALAPFIKMVTDGLTSALKWLNSFREKILDFAHNAEFVFKNFGDYADLYLQKAGLAVVNFYNDSEQFITALPTIFSEAFDSIVATIEHAIDQSLLKVAEFAEQSGGFLRGLIPGLDILGQPAVVDALRERAEASGRRLDEMADIGERLDGVLDRAETAFEANLRQSVDRLQADLDKRKKEFLAGKKSDLNVNQGGKGKGISEVTGQGRNAVAERGSQEAFAIIAGQQKDKYLKVANEKLTEARKTNKLLDKILNKKHAAAIGRGKV